jgi:ribonuclease HII
MDEVGRGSPAGPAFVGVIVVDFSTGPAPVGVRDSKLVSPAAREALVPAIEAWAVDRALGESTAEEVDCFGVTAALGLAGRRALARLALAPDLVLLDGNHDWLTCSVTDEACGSIDGPACTTPVVTKVKADRSCASVAAASILAKVARDAVMTGLAEEFPGYGWEENKGYGTPDHLAALRRLGPSPHHRVTWRLPEPVPTVCRDKDAGIRPIMEW